MFFWLFDVCIESSSQKRHRDAEPGMYFGAYSRGAIHGHDWWLKHPAWNNQF